MNTSHHTTSHSGIEDLLAMLTGTLLVSFGLWLLRAAGIMTGGTAGIAILLHYAFSVPFGIAFFLLNIPFLYLAIRRMGLQFTFKTFFCVALVSVFSSFQDQLIHVDKLAPLYAAFLGSIISGIGFLILFRHHGSLGGVNILALYIQDRFGFQAGWVQLIIDICILLLSLSTLSMSKLAVSAIGLVILNLVIAMNHRKDRYSA